MLNKIKLGILLSCLSLAACGVQPQQPQTTGASGSYSEPRVAMVAIPSPIPPDQDYKRPLQERLLSDLTALKGAEEAELLPVFGRPKFKRKESQSELWQYRQPECTLDVFLYNDGDIRRVKHFEIRSLGSVKVSAEECLSTVMQRKI